MLNKTNNVVGLSIKSIFGVLLAFLFWNIIGSMMYIGCRFLFPFTQQGFASLILQYLTFIFLPLGVFLVSRIMLKVPFKYFLSDKIPFSFKKTSIYFFFTLCICVILFLIDLLINLDSYTFTFTWDLIWKGFILLPLIILASASEELLFRGYFYKILYGLKHGILWAIIIPSIFFALIHGLNAEMSLSLLMPLFYLLMGLLLATVRFYTKGIWASTAIHSAYNFMVIILFSYSSSTMESYNVPTFFHRDHLNIVYFIVSVIVCGMIYSIYQKKTNDQKERGDIS